MKDNDTLSIRIYTSESQIRTPRNFLRAMWRDLYNSRELAWRLFVRDFSAQFRQSFFGIFWVFLPPIVTSLIFIFLQSRNIVNFRQTAIPYPIYVLVGTILWQLFTESLNIPLKTLNNSKPMLAKINFPYEALIVSGIFSIMFSLLIKLIVLVAIYIFFHYRPGWGVIFAPIPILFLIMLGIGIGLFITPFGMLYTDVNSALPVITQLWFFITPVVYPPPDVYPMSLIVTLNPVSPLLIAARDLLTTGVIINPVPVFVVGGFSAVLLFVSWIFYRISIPILIERIGA